MHIQLSSAIRSSAAQCRAAQCCAFFLVHITMSTRYVRMRRLGCFPGWTLELWVPGICNSPVCTFVITLHSSTAWYLVPGTAVVVRCSQTNCGCVCQYHVPLCTRLTCEYCCCGARRACSAPLSRCTERRPSAQANRRRCSFPASCLLVVGAYLCTAVVRKLGRAALFLVRVQKA